MKKKLLTTFVIVIISVTSYFVGRFRANEDINIGMRTFSECYWFMRGIDFYHEYYLLDEDNNYSSSLYIKNEEDKDRDALKELVPSQPVIVSITNEWILGKWIGLRCEIGEEDEKKEVFRELWFKANRGEKKVTFFRDGERQPGTEIKQKIAFYSRNGHPSIPSHTYIPEHLRVDNRAIDLKAKKLDKKASEKAAVQQESAPPRK